MRAFMTVLLLASAAPLAAQQVAYPEGYRDWKHISTMIIEPGHPLYDAFGGLHSLYANREAVEGYLKGRFPNGSVIVFDLQEAEREGGAITAGARKVLGVMVKNDRAYAATGGWGFEGFKGDTRERAVGDQAASSCFACHTAQKEHDFVFSRLR